MKLIIVVEKMGNILQGRIEGHGWMPTPFGKTVTELKKNLKELVGDYVAHEGVNDKFWNKINWSKIDIEIQHDLQNLFDTYSYLNFSEIADRIGIQKSQFTHYKTGYRKASEKQARRIEEVLHEVGKELTELKLLS